MRKPRADGERNRERLLEAAKAGFAEAGPEVSLEEIARRAGVGIGTLYRHFPTRDALIEAVYRRELEGFAEAGDQLAATLPPGKALHAWMHLLVDYIATKHGMYEVLNSIVGGTSDLYSAFDSPATDRKTTATSEAEKAPDAPAAGPPPGGPAHQPRVRPPDERAPGTRTIGTPETDLGALNNPSNKQSASTRFYKPGSF